MEQELLEKYDRLKRYLSDLDSVGVAYSSGVDSTFLLKVAHDVLGENAFAITVKSNSFPEHEYEEGRAYCEKEHILQIVCELNELDIPGFADNPPNRCYLCKKELFSRMKSIAEENGAGYLVEGSNVDDMEDYRPGMKAVLELGIKSPLRQSGLSKEEIRILSRKLNLPTWDKPSFSCLSTRFPYGEVITREKLDMVEQAERLLFQMGFRQARVRVHQKVARIELLPEDFSRCMDEALRENIVSGFKKIGFVYVCLDLQGYRMGSMNEVL